MNAPYTARQTSLVVGGTFVPTSLDAKQDAVVFLTMDNWLIVTDLQHRILEVRPPKNHGEPPLIKCEQHRPVVGALVVLAPWLIAAVVIVCCKVFG